MSGSINFLSEACDRHEFNFFFEGSMSSILLVMAMACGLNGFANTNLNKLSST
jgi:hypothetical protein